MMKGGMATHTGRLLFVAMRSSAEADMAANDATLPPLCCYM